MQGNISDVLILILTCAPTSTACLKKDHKKLMVMVLPQGTGFSTADSENGSGLGLLHTGISHPHSVDSI